MNMLEAKTEIENALFCNNRLSVDTMLYAFAAIDEYIARHENVGKQDEERMKEIICEAIQTDECLHACNRPYCYMVENAVNSLIANNIVVQKYGKWKPHKPDSRGYTCGFLCSNCNNIIYTDYSMKECDYEFCPSCGAKMEDEHR